MAKNLMRNLDHLPAKKNTRKLEPPPEEAYQLHCTHLHTRAGVYGIRCADCGEILTRHAP